jgi:hypothetical protein
MRYLIGSQIGWAAVPFVLIVGAAYLWLADRWLGRKADVQTSHERESITKAA